MQDLLPENASKFWQWFRETSTSLAERSDHLSHSDIARIDAEVANAVDGATWEIGPGISSPHAFVLSPNRSRERLSLTRQIVARAPIVPGWEFYAARPKKRWQFRVDMFNAKGQKLSIDAAEWRYSLIAYDNRSFFDVTLYAENMPQMDETASRQAGWIVIEGALGEELAVERVGYITFHDLGKSFARKRTGRIDRLYDHLIQLIAGGPDAEPSKLWP